MTQYISRYSSGSHRPWVTWKLPLPNVLEITRKAIIRINQSSKERYSEWHFEGRLADSQRQLSFHVIFQIKNLTCTYARHLTSCGIDPLLIYQLTTRQRSYILCLSATFAIASPIMKLVLYLLCIVLHVSVLSTSARIFSWDNINYVYAFGDSYSFVQGTKGHANFRCVCACVCVYERERNGQSFAKPSKMILYSFIGDKTNFAFTPQDLLQNEIIPRNVSLSHSSPQKGDWRRYIEPDKLWGLKLGKQSGASEGLFNLTDRSRAAWISHWMFSR